MAEPHQQVVVDQGSTKATVHTADGRITQVSVNPDGTIVRNQVFTDDEGRKVEVHDDGREHQEVTTDLSRGIVTTDKVAADGTMTHEERTARDDGGLDIVTTDGNGHLVQTERVTKYQFGEEHVIQTADGKVTTRTTAFDEDGNTETNEVRPNGDTYHTYVIMGADGAKKTIEEYPGGTRSEVNEYTTKEGDHVRVETGIDLKTVMQTTHADGSIDERTEYPEGGVDTKSWTLYPDGTAQMSLERYDGTRQTVLQSKQPDGTYVTKTTESTGDVTEQHVYPDGLVVRTTRNDKTEIETRQISRADGSGQTIVTHPGEAPEVTIDEPVLPHGATDEPPGPLPPIDQAPAAEPDPAALRPVAHPQPAADDGPAIRDALDIAAPKPGAGDSNFVPGDKRISDGEDGSTSVRIQGDGGLVTHVAVTNDGTITRTQEWDDASTGAHITRISEPDGTTLEQRSLPDGTFNSVKLDIRGDVVESEVRRTEPDGTKVSETTFADNTKEIKRESIDPDGTERTVVTNRDGSEHVRTVATTYEVDTKSSVQVIRDGDVTSTTTTGPDGRQETVRQYEDGTSDRTNVERLPDGTRVETLTDTRGGQTVTRTTNEPQGLVRSVTTDPDGKTTETIDQRYVNPNGDTVERHEAGGESVQTITRGDGSTDSHTVHADGRTSDVSFQRFPDGTTVRDTTNPDGTREVLTQRINDDASITTEVQRPDGSTHQHTVDGEGKVVGQTVDPDGGTARTVSNPDGSGSTHFAEPGEEEHVVLHDPVLAFPTSGRGGGLELDDEPQHPLDPLPPRPDDPDAPDEPHHPLDPLPPHIDPVDPVTPQHQDQPQIEIQDPPDFEADDITPQPVDLGDVDAPSHAGDAAARSGAAGTVDGSPLGDADLREGVGAQQADGGGDVIDGGEVDDPAPIDMGDVDQPDATLGDLLNQTTSGVAGHLDGIQPEPQDPVDMGELDAVPAPEPAGFDLGTDSFTAPAPAPAPEPEPAPAPEPVVVAGADVSGAGAAGAVESPPEEPTYADDLGAMAGGAMGVVDDTSSDDDSFF